MKSKWEHWRSEKQQHTASGWHWFCCPKSRVLMTSGAWLVSLSSWRMSFVADVTFNWISWWWRSWAFKLTKTFYISVKPEASNLIELCASRRCAFSICVMVASVLDTDWLRLLRKAKQSQAALMMCVFVCCLWDFKKVLNRICFRQQSPALWGKHPSSSVTLERTHLPWKFVHSFLIFLNYSFLFS